MGLSATAAVVGATAAVAGTGYSIYAGQQAADQAEEAYESSEGLTEAQVAAIKAQEARAAEQWEIYKNTYLPVYEQMSADQLETYLPLQEALANQYLDVYMPFQNQIIDLAKQGIEPDYQGVMDKASADVIQAYEKAEDMGNRNMLSYGINPASGRFESFQREMDIARAKDEAYARTMAREREKSRAETQGFSNMLQAASLAKGVNIPGLSGDPSASSNAALSNAISGYGSAANQYQQMGNTAAAYGAQSSYGAGQLMQQLPSNISTIGTGLSGLFGSDTGAANYNYSLGDYGSTLYDPSQYDFSFSSYAKGGPVTGEEPIIVGEKGPEIFVPNSPGFVVPNDRSKKMLGQFGSNVINRKKQTATPMGGSGTMPQTTMPVQRAQLPAPPTEQRGFNANNIPGGWTPSGNVAQPRQQMPSPRQQTSNPLPWRGQNRVFNPQHQRQQMSAPVGQPQPVAPVRPVQPAQPNPAQPGSYYTGLIVPPGQPQPGQRSTGLIDPSRRFGQFGGGGGQGTRQQQFTPSAPRPERDGSRQQAGYGYQREYRGVQAQPEDLVYAEQQAAAQQAQRGPVPVAPSYNRYPQVNPYATDQYGTPYSVPILPQQPAYGNFNQQSGIYNQAPGQQFEPTNTWTPQLDHLQNGNVDQQQLTDWINRIIAMRNQQQQPTYGPAY